MITKIEVDGFKSLRQFSLNLHQGLNVLLFIKAVTHLPAQRVSIITYIEPLSAVILAFLFLREIPNIFTLIGGLLILTSSYLTIKE